MSKNTLIKSTIFIVLFLIAMNLENKLLTWICFSLAFGVIIYPFFMKKDFVRGLNYINGSFTGVRIEHTKKKIRTNIDHFEDYLFSILHYIRDKNVLKASNVCLKTKCFNTTGGICSHKGGLVNRKEEAVTNSDLLESHFGELLYLKHSKKYDIINIQLKKMKWRESYLDLWDNYNKHTNQTEKKDIVFDNLEKDLENWNVDYELQEITVQS